MLSDIVSLGVWDGLLEGRIRLHWALVLSNRLPQHDTVKLYHQLGRQPLKTALRQSECFTGNTIQSFYSLCFPGSFSMAVKSFEVGLTMPRPHPPNYKVVLVVKAFR